jgi:ferritin-like protein
MNKSIEVTPELERRQEAALITPSDLKAEATGDIAGAMNAILADVFALYLKTKNFHWHMSGPHFRDYHLLFDEQGDQLFAMTDPIAERIRKLGGTTLRSIGHIARLQLSRRFGYVGRAASPPDEVKSRLAGLARTRVMSTRPPVFRVRTSGTRAGRH